MVMYDITFLNSSRFESSTPGSRLPASCRSCDFKSVTSLFPDGCDGDGDRLVWAGGAMPKFCAVCTVRSNREGEI